MWRALTTPADTYPFGGSALTCPPSARRWVRPLRPRRRPFVCVGQARHLTGWPHHCATLLFTWSARRLPHQDRGIPSATAYGPRCLIGRAILWRSAALRSPGRSGRFVRALVVGGRPRFSRWLPTRAVQGSANCLPGWVPDVATVLSVYVSCPCLRRAVLVVCRNCPIDVVRTHAYRACRFDIRVGAPRCCGCSGGVWRAVPAAPPQVCPAARPVTLWVHLPARAGRTLLDRAPGRT